MLQGDQVLEYAIAELLEDGEIVGARSTGVVVVTRRVTRSTRARVRSCDLTASRNRLRTVITPLREATLWTTHATLWTTYATLWTTKVIGRPSLKRASVARNATRFRVVGPILYGVPRGDETTMATCAPSNGTRHVMSKADEALRLDDLLRVLVDKVAAAHPPPASDTANDREEIIVDIELDGTRYLVVRLPATTRARVVLSPREQEIVRMVAQGHPNKIIADVLSISSWTVGTHLRRIFAKLGVGSRAAMIARLGAVDHSGDLESVSSKKRLSR